MNKVIYCLILFFVLLFIFSFISSFTTPYYSWVPNYSLDDFWTFCNHSFKSNNDFEGMDSMDTSGNSQWKDYDQSNALILAQQNAGNIQYLKERIADYDKINQHIFDLSGNVDTLNTEVEQIVQAQSDYVSQNMPATVPPVSSDDLALTDTSNTTNTNTTDTSNMSNMFGTSTTYTT